MNQRMAFTMSSKNAITFKPLGDQAILAYLPDESSASRFAASVRGAAFPWLEDVVPAYASVGIHYDGDRVQSADVLTALKGLRPARASAVVGALRVIPCCYGMQLDLNRVAEHKSLSTDQVIALHSGIEYAIHAIGFAPGFPYLGYLPPELTGVPRLPSPRLRVEPGSVGLTGKQTGVYPQARPGGWNLIGRTPLVLVDVNDNYFPLRVGDRVSFKRIDEAEFQRLAGERLPLSRGV